MTSHCMKNMSGILLNSATYSLVIGDSKWKRSRPEVLCKRTALHDLRLIEV